MQTVKYELNYKESESWVKYLDKKRKTTQTKILMPTEERLTRTMRCTTPDETWASLRKME